MAAAADAPPLRMLSVNINGMHDSRKRRAFFQQLAQGRWDVVLLQETHHGSHHPAAWTKEGWGPGHPWLGQGFWAQGTTASCGVAILLSDTAPLTNISQAPVPAAGGRILRVDATYAGSPIALVSVYAPSEAADRPSFFSHDLPLALPPSSIHTFVAGDFNCILDPIDQQGGSTTRRFIGSNELANVMVSAGLEDSWRALHPTLHSFTHVATNTNGLGQRTSSRLDRWLSPATLHPWLQEATISDYVPSDHCAISLVLSPPTDVLRGPGAWHFPLHLLANETFTTKFTAYLTTFLSDHPITPSTTHRSRWELLKHSIRCFTTNFAQETSKRTNSERRALEGAAAQARAQLLLHPGDFTCTAAWESTTTALRNFLLEQQDRMYLRNCALWDTYGEQSTYWFHRLGQQRSPHQPSTITSIRNPLNPLQLLSPTDFLQVGATGDALSAFFSSDSPVGLYKVSTPDLTAQATLLDSIDAVLHPDVSARVDGDGSLSLGELTVALHASANGKVPGSDGIPYEVYRAFWETLGPELKAVADETFTAASVEPTPLPVSMQKGVIKLLYKGGGLPKEDADSYRPITLLNTDYKPGQGRRQSHRGAPCQHHRRHPDSLSA